MHGRSVEIHYGGQGRGPRLETLARIPCQHAIEERSQRRRNSPEDIWIALRARANLLPQRGRWKERPHTQEFEQHEARGVYVGGRPHGLVQKLLRRHERRRT
jgi:hypothetical protein